MKLFIKAMLVMGILLHHAYSMSPSEIVIDRILRENHMRPLDRFEKIEVLRQKEQNIPVKINRSIEDYNKVCEEKNVRIKTLILCSGTLHANDGPRSETYTIDTMAIANPDMVGSINDAHAMGKIPDGTFDEVIWENAPNQVLFDTTSFNEAYRILKEGGIAKFGVNNMCGRLMPIILNYTHFKGQLKLNEFEDIATMDDILNNTPHSANWKNNEKLKSIKLIKH